MYNFPNFNVILQREQIKTIKNKLTTIKKYMIMLHPFQKQLIVMFLTAQ